MNFTMDLSDLWRLEKFFKQGGPRELKNSVANVLNNLAFKGKEIEQKIIEKNMIVRNRRFVETSIQVKKTNRGPIESLVSYLGSVKRDGFTGWAEQETGEPMRRKRVSALPSRKGNMRNIMQARARLKHGNQFWKPQQFNGQDYQKRFYFMMRVLGSRGGQQYFLLDKDIITKRGSLNRGLYVLIGHRIVRLQSFKTAQRMKHVPWQHMMIEELSSSKYIKRLWGDQLDYLCNKGYNL